DLEPLLREDHRRMREPAVFEARRTGEPVLAGKGGAAVGLGLELAGGVAGAGGPAHPPPRGGSLPPDQTPPRPAARWWAGRGADRAATSTISLHKHTSAPGSRSRLRRSPRPG